MENKEQLFDKISAYYSGDENKDAIKKELEQSQESKELLHWVNVLWYKFNPKPGRSASIQHRTQIKIEKIPDAGYFFRLKVVKYAAVILLALCLSGITYYYSGQNTSLITLVSGTGEVREVVLPDGSKVWLNARSSLQYPEKFNKKFREITMTGEVYFEVNHDPQHPFVVSSGLVQVKVLGTRFLVSNYDNESEINTYLSEGCVELELTELKKTMELTPGDEVVFNRETLAVTKVNHPRAAPDSWRFGKLTFYNETLYEIARKLERRFGKEILIADDAVGNMNYTADFDDESLEQILRFLDEGSAITFKKVGNGYMLTKK